MRCGSRGEENTPTPHRLTPNTFMLSRFVALIAVLFWLGRCHAAQIDPSVAPYEESVLIMGTVGRVQIWGLSKEKARRLCEAIFLSWKEVDSTMSLYKPASDLVRLNEHAGKGPVTVSSDLIDILIKAQAACAKTHGAFDVRVGALIELWGLGVHPREGVPTIAEVRRAAYKARHARIALDPIRCRAAITQTGVQIDLGGIAKGYALDKAAALVYRARAKRSLLDLGGQLMAIHPPPSGWVIGLREPGNPQGSIGTLRIRRTCSLSTSSQEDRFRKEGTIQRGHILDPRLGRPVSRSGSVSVLARSGTQADALSTAMLILKPQEAVSLLRQWEGVDVLRLQRVRAKGHGTNRWRIWQSPGMKKIFTL